MIQHFSRLLRYSLLVSVALLLSSAFAQPKDPPVGVAVKIWTHAYMEGDSGQLEVSGSFLESSPGANDGDAWNSALFDENSASNEVDVVLGDQGYVRVEPAKTYSINVGGENMAAGALNIIAPPGYRVVMDNMMRTRETFEGGSIITFQLLPLGARHPGLAGMASSISSTDIEWRLSLGALMNGNSAGDLALIDTGMKSDWSAVFTPSTLYYEAVSDEITVTRNNNVIQQILASQVAINIVTLSATSYEIRCYNPSQKGSSSFNGSAYVTYRVEQGATATTLKITKEERDVTDTTSTFPVSRREIMTLARTGTWPNVTWTKRDWTLENQTSLSETYVVSTGSTSSRTETIAVRTPGASTPAISLSRSYTAPTVGGQSVVGEVVSSETLGTTNSLTASFDYYTDTSDFGSLGYVKSTSKPGDGWAAYDYYPTDITSNFRGGRLKYKYQPYLNAPASISHDSSLGKVTYYEYVNDKFGAPTRPSLVQTTINGTVVAKTATTYNDGALDGPIDESVRTEYADSSHGLNTTTRSYPADGRDSFFRGQPFSTTGPDGVRQCFAYIRGAWNGTSFIPKGTWASGVITTDGSWSRIAVLTGTANAVSGAAHVARSTYGADDTDEIYLIDGKSTRAVTIRNPRALIARTESYVWKHNQWNLTTSTDFTYDFGGRLIGRTSSNGATYSATYVGGLKTSETDEAGVTTNYTYDAAGQILTATRVGSGVVASLATHFVYDAAGHTIEEDVGWGQTEQVVTSRTYDDASRLATETPPGAYGSIAHSYNIANRRHMITRADGGTVISEAFVDGHDASTTGTSTVGSYHTYGVETDGRQWHQVNVGTATSPRWQKSWTDWLGRDVKDQSPGYTGQPDRISENFYDATNGHLTKATKLGYAPTLYEYNPLGQVSRSGLDVNNDGVLTLTSSDRIGETETYAEYYQNAWWSRTDTRSYPTAGASTVVLNSIARTRLTGHPANRLTETQTTDVEGNTTHQVIDINRTARTSTTTTTRSDVPGSRVETTVNGLSTSITDFDGLQSGIQYDALLRTHSTTDPRGNTTTTTYVAGTKLVLTVTDAAGNSATTGYDAQGRVSWKRDPKSYTTRFGYNLRDQVVHQWGDGTLPVEYTFDATYATKSAMSTYRGGTGWSGTDWPGTGSNSAASPGTADTTQWTYDGPSGLLIQKTDALNRTAAQTYNQRGQTATRTLARGVVTTYGYDGATGELLSQTYSDSTPAVSYTYNRSGLVDTVTDVTGMRDMVYDESRPWRLSTEAESAFYGNRVQTRLYAETATIGRVNGLQLGDDVGSNSDLEQTFGFTSVGRFETITSNRQGNSADPRTFRYGYLANSSLLDTLAIDGGSPFSVKRTYEDHRDIIIGLDSKWSTSTRTSFAYTYDERGQRSKVVQSGDAFADYGDVVSQQFVYDGAGQLTSAVGYLGTDITDATKQMPGRRYGYAYDAAGNRKWSDRTGVDTDHDGLPDLRDNYTTNALNQYVSRENNTVPLSGTAATDTPPSGGAGGTSVAVQTRTVPAGRQGRYWNDEITVPNVLHPYRGPVTIFTAKRGSGGSDAYRMDLRMIEIAGQLENFTYDADGNLTSDGLVDYTWDAENRLVRMETNASAQLAGFPHTLIEFKYDYMGRRVQKRVIDVDRNVELSSRRFLYDGWNLVAEYLAPGGATVGELVRSYTWGLDIALSTTNAGGVGALLQITDHASRKTFLPTYDGNGNITSLLNADTGALAAVYEYSAFGEPLRAQTIDSTVADQPFRFSTKWTDLETGLVYYGHRYYDPHQGRFINRDPIEEEGGLNLYGFCANDAINRWDVLGHHISLDGSTWDGDYDDTTTSMSVADAAGLGIIHWNPKSGVWEDTSAWSDFDPWDTGVDADELALDNVFQQMTDAGERDAAREAEKAANAAAADAFIAALSVGLADKFEDMRAQFTKNFETSFVAAMNAGYDHTSDSLAQALNAATANAFQETADKLEGTFSITTTGSVTGNTTAPNPQGGPTGSTASSLPGATTSSPLSGHPDYDPSKWNDGGARNDGKTIQGNTNCYAYACNQKGPFSGHYGMDPGNASGNPITKRSDISVNGIRDRAIADGLSATPVAGGYPVYLVVSPGRDYHWYRQDSNGDWSQKPGSTPVNNVDASGNRITDPSTADHNYPAINYTQPGGYLWVPPGFHF
jgi:RHS repeat-associated protein